MVKEMKLDGTKDFSSAAEEPKWSAQMLESFEQAKRGEWVVGDINNFWGNI